MDLRVLIASSSRHGSTSAIADRIGHTLARALGARGLCVEIDIAETSRATGVGMYDAVVLGSAVYAGRWLRSAENFVAVHREELRERPVWIFSSGPVGDPPTPAETAAKPAQLAADIGARGHAVFAGRVDSASLGFAERTVVKALRVPDGDFRDWRAIDGWATSVAQELCEVWNRVPLEPMAAR